MDPVSQRMYNNCNSGHNTIGKDLSSNTHTNDGEIALSIWNNNTVQKLGDDATTIQDEQPSHIGDYPYLIGQGDRGGPAVEMTIPVPALRL